MSIPSAFDLKDKVTIITGGGSGIGRACANLLFQYQSKLLLVDLNPNGLNETIEGLKAFGDPEGRVISMALNITIKDDMTRMAEQAVEQFGRIDHLIASAGILRAGPSLKPFQEITLDEWDKVVRTNLTGTFLSNQAVLPAMLNQRQGDIINISSISGRQGRAFDSAYSASKAGIIGLSEALAEEVSNYGIRVQALLPDAVDTPLWNQNDAKAIKPTVSLTPERVAEFIIYLIALPRDTFLLNPVIAAFKTRRKRPKVG